MPPSASRTARAASCCRRSCAPTRGLDKDVVIIGVSNRAEIWNAERWAALEAEELNPENLAAVMEELGF